MAKATIETKDGTKIQIDGDAEEIKKIVAALQTPVGKPENRSERKASGATKTKRKDDSSSPMKRIENLKEKGFFAQQKGLSEIVEELKKEGHIYPITHVSAPVLRLLRKGVLRRLKGEKGWQYVNP